MVDYSFDAVCQLGNFADNVTAAGDAEETVIYGEDVFCYEKSVGYREIHAGAARRYRPDVVLIMPFDAYDQERYVKYNDEVYKVVQTYRLDWNIELTLERD